MMRWIFLAVVVITLTVMATVALRFLPARSSAILPVVSGRDQKQPVAVVEGASLYNFGEMPQRGEGHRSWVVRNEGQANLELWKIRSSCTCTLANLREGQRAIVPPGDQTEIRLDWHTREQKGPFRTETVIGTNDPSHEVLLFEIQGIVQPPYELIPSLTAMEFQSIPCELSPTRSVILLFPDRPESTVTAVISSRPELVEVSAQPLTEAERQDLKAEGKAESGHHLDIQIHPGTHLGEFREEVIVRSDHPKSPEISLPVTGRIVGPISAVPDQVRAGTIAGNRGGSVAVTLWARNREEPTTYQVIQAPKVLQVAIDPVEETGQADGSTVKAHRSRLTVTVPPGTPSGLISGQIVLKTDHPQADQLTLPVRIVVTSED